MFRPGFSTICCEVQNRCQNGQIQSSQVRLLWFHRANMSVCLSFLACCGLRVGLFLFRSRLNNAHECGFGFSFTSRSCNIAV